jgi:iron(II)-dependent oxidoreductase
MDYRLNPCSDVYCQQDQLGFDKYVETLHSIIKDKDFKTPFCIGIYGRWGSGKTSFMHLLENRLLKDDSSPHVVPAWFNPWRYEKEEHLIIPFLKTVESEINKYLKDKQGLKEKIAEELQNAAQKLSSAASAILYGLKPELSLGLAKLQFDVAKSVDRGKVIEEKQLSIAEKLSSIYYDVVTELKNAVVEKEFRIAVFVDDLDRCLPEKTVELLESIKLFLDLEGYLFIIGVDKGVVTKGISYHYRFFEPSKGESDERQTISPDDYLDKMIQLPLELPPIEFGRKQKFIQSMLGGSDEFKEHSDIIEMGVGDNPRTLKRFVNLLVFTVRLAETIKENILKDKVEPKETEKHKDLLRDYFIPILYMKWAIIVFRFPRIHRDIRGNRGRLIELQAAALDQEVVDETGEKTEVQRKLQLDDRLRRVLGKGKQFPNDVWLLDRFIHLTESTVISEKEKDLSKGYGQTFSSGEMVRIPKGNFLYGDDKVEKSIDYDYYIDVFPVNNKLYKEFLDENKEWQVPHKESDENEPYNWDKDTRSYPKGKSDHPVVLVSFEDAEQFCKWRSQKKGKEYRLPSEEEWEKAARGTDGRDYPWGNEFDKDNCNVEESGLGETTEVNRYSNGTSPFGCYDMSGNVFEWTSTWYDTSQRNRVLRGGSWYSYRNEARCAYRLRINPVVRYTFIGFRCARTL